MGKFEEQIGDDLEAIREAGLWRELRQIESTQSTRIKLGGRKVINFSSNLRDSGRTKCTSTVFPQACQEMFRTSLFE